MTPRPAACAPRRRLRPNRIAARTTREGRSWRTGGAVTLTLLILEPVSGIEVVSYNRCVADTDKPLGSRPGALASARASEAARSSTDKVLCERCGAEMFRMHAVWRCPACGYKTDCCGW